MDLRNKTNKNETSMKKRKWVPLVELKKKTTGIDFF